MKIVMRSLVLILFVVSVPLAWAADPKCDGPQRWTAVMALGQLQDAGLTNGTKTVHDKISVKRLASQRVGKDLYRQVHRVTYPQSDGSSLEVITVSDASHQECSMGDVQVFLVSRKLGK